MIMKNRIPCFCHPTRKILLDDDKEFSQSVALKMHGKNFTAYHSVNEMLDYFTTKYKPSYSNRDLTDLLVTHSECMATHSFNKKFDSSHNNTFYDDISILFIDYHMPEMCGLDFLEKISTLPFKKILMTGEHDYMIGINAFNNGLIDGYIRKYDANFLTHLSQMTDECEWNYFTDLSQPTFDLPAFDYLHNEHVINLFTQLLSKKNITHFHLIDKQGTFCMHTVTGEKEYFVLKTTQQLKQLSELALDDGTPEKSANKIAKGAVIPFFNLKQHWEVPGNEWDRYLYSANRLSENAEYFWTNITLNELVKKDNQQGQVTRQTSQTETLQKPSSI